MKTRYSCSSCAFMRAGKIRMRYSHKTGYIYHDGMLCHLYPPKRDTYSPVEPGDICSRWTDKKTFAQPLAHLAPAVITTATTSSEETKKNETEVRE